MRLNGEQMPDFTGSVGELLANHGIRAEGTAVALNGEIVPRSQWSQVQIPRGADVEILTATAGG